MYLFKWQWQPIFVRCNVKHIFEFLGYILSSEMCNIDAKQNTASHFLWKCNQSSKQWTKIVWNETKKKKRKENSTIVKWWWTFTKQITYLLRLLLYTSICKFMWLHKRKMYFDVYQRKVFVQRKYALNTASIA